MSETIVRWLEPVIKHPVVQSIITHYFICGIICGIILVYLLRFLLWLCFGKKYSSEIAVKSESGMITISAAAIASVIIHACKTLTCLDIRRVRIFSGKNGYSFNIRAAMNAKEGTAPELMKNIIEIVRSQMKTVFGIDNILDVSLEIVNCGGSADNDVPPESPADEKDDKDPEFFHSAGHGDRTISLKKSQPEKTEENK